ncbi:MAG TPA: hypothetical protein VKX17_08455 [Planctomycetota bacterium]|nr:hypothetical protein [Planctomycetota bacterium]
MTEVPRRKWLQVHLSTAVVLMFAAGGIIWGNVREGKRYYIRHRVTTSFVHDNGSDDNQSREYYSMYGWPFVAFETNWFVKQRDPGGRVTDSYLKHWVSASLNLIIALAILFAVWFVCETWIAWRAGRKKG